MVQEVEINWQRLVNAVVKKLRYSFGYMGQDELCSAAGLGLTLAYKKFNPEWGSVIGFLMTKGYWMSFDRLRTMANKNKGMIPFDNEILDDNKSRVSSQKQLSQFEELIAHLSPKDKERLRDRYLNGFLLKDTAKKFNCSASYASMNLKEVLARLRQRMIRRDNLGWNVENITEKQSRQIVAALKNPPPIKNL